MGYYSHEYILQLYQPYKLKYMEKLFEIQRKRIKVLID